MRKSRAFFILFFIVGFFDLSYSEDLAQPNGETQKTENLTPPNKNSNDENKDSSEQKNQSSETEQTFKTLNYKNIRTWYQEGKYQLIYTKIYSSIQKKEIQPSWFDYAMLAESSYKIGKAESLKKIFSFNKTLYQVYRAFVFAQKGKILDSASILGALPETIPEFCYLAGKMYFMIGHIKEASAFLKLSTNMEKAPYGAYYSALAQESLGYYSQAISLLSQVKSMLLPSEKKLAFSTDMHLAKAYFGNEKYQEAYKISMTLYKKNPSTIIKNIDPGVILVGMQQYKMARDFWVLALKQRLNYKARLLVQKRLKLNKYLMDPSYPPKYMR